MTAPDVVVCHFPGCNAPGDPWSGPWADYLVHAQGHPIPPQEDRAAWLAARRTFLGGSEIAQVAGLSRYGNALDVWAAKVEGVDPGALQEKADPKTATRFRLGHLMEPVILRDFADRHGVQVAGVAKTLPTRRRYDAPWAAASPDGLIFSPDAGQGALVGASEGVQIKLVGAHQAHRWVDGPPREVLAQVAWEAWVWDLRRVWVVAGIGGTDVEDFPVDRDDDLIASLREIGQAFWEGAVIPRQLPQDFDALPSEATIRALFPRDSGVMLQASPDFVAMAGEYDRARKEILALEAVKDDLKARMQLAIGPATGAEWRDGRVRWKLAQGPVAWEDLARELAGRQGVSPDAFAAMIEAHRKPGSRRFDLRFKSEQTAPRDKP